MKMKALSSLPRFRFWRTEAATNIDDKESVTDELAAHRARLEFHRSELDTLHGYYDGMSGRVRTLVETHENLLKTIQRYAEIAGLHNDRMRAIEQAIARIEHQGVVARPAKTTRRRSRKDKS